MKLGLAVVATLDTPPHAIGDDAPVSRIAEPRGFCTRVRGCWRSWAGAVLAAGLLAGCGDGGDRDPAATTPASTPVAAPGAPRYAVVGDSYSNGEGLAPDQAWPVKLAARVGVELVANPAVSGYTAEDAIAEELDAFEAADPEVATLMIGANDAFGGRDPGSFRRSFRTLLARMVRSVGDAARIVVVTIPDYTRKPLGARDDPQTISRFNAVIRAEAQRAGAPVADVFPVSRQPTAPSPDGLHPSAAELDAWLTEIEPVARAAWGR